jgi:hypothetical protein
MKSLTLLALAVSLASCATTSSNDSDRIERVPDPWQGPLADKMRRDWEQAHPSPPAHGRDLASKDTSDSDGSGPVFPDDKPAPDQPQNELPQN